MSKKSILWAFLVAATSLTARAQQQPARDTGMPQGIPWVTSVAPADAPVTNHEDVLTAKDDFARDVYRTIMNDVYRRYQTITPANFDSVLNDYRQKENERARRASGHQEIERPYEENVVLSMIDSLRPSINFKEENRYYGLLDAMLKRPPADRARIEALNAEVLQAARDDFPAIYARTRNSMSRDLDKLRAEFKNDSVRVADPQEAVYAVAMGINVSDTTFIFNGGGARWHEEHTRSVLESSVEIMRVASTSAQVIRRKDMAPWRIVVPETLYSEYHHPHGFTNEEDVLYTNLHEKYHVEDSHFLKVYDNAITYYAATAARMKAESYADVAAIGDMLMAGHRLSILDDIMIWRSLYIDEDMGHFTLPSMQGFKDTLTVMGNGDLKNGVAAMKAMCREDVLLLYQDVVKTHGMTADDFSVFEAFASQAEHNRDRIRERAHEEGEEEAKRIIAVYDQVQAYKNGYCLTVADSNLADDYDGIKEIKNRAFKNSGVILPNTICKAYADLQDEMRAKAAVNNDQKIYARMRRLESDFIMYTSYTDYFGENKARGVDLFKYLGKEPLPDARVNGIMAKSSVRNPVNNGQ